MTALLDAPRPEPRRDRWGRYLINPAGGGNPRAYTRATTIAKTLDDQSSLINWSMRMCALGLITRKDLYAQVAACRPDDRDTLTRLVDQAKEAGGGTAGANIGTALHAFTERIDLGETVNIPDQWAPDINAYQQTIRNHGLTVRRDLIERIVVLEELGVAGTIDRVYQTTDGRLVIGDLKTGANLDFNRLAISIQLAIYAHADTIYNPADETHTPMVDVDKTTALVVHLPAEQACCRIYEVDIAAGWGYVQLAQQVRAARNHGRRSGDNLFRRYQPPEPAAPQAPHRQWILERLEQIRANPDAARAMAANWPHGVPGLKTGHQHTPAELDQIAAVIDKVETTFELPFTPDPRTPKPAPRPEPPPLPAPIDEGPNAPKEHVRNTILKVDNLPHRMREQVNQWAGEANLAGLAFNLKTLPSRRRVLLYIACINLAELDDHDAVRASLNAVAPGTSGLPVGAVLGGLTIPQTNQLLDLINTIRTQTPALNYQADGTVTWQTTTQQISEAHNQENTTK